MVRFILANFAIGYGTDNRAVFVDDFENDTDHTFAPVMKVSKVTQWPPLDCLDKAVVAGSKVADFGIMEDTEGFKNDDENPRQAHPPFLCPARPIHSNADHNSSKMWLLRGRGKSRTNFLTPVRPAPVPAAPITTPLTHFTPA